MTVNDWLSAISLGLVCGALGQGLRIVAGLKKLADQATDTSSVSDQLVVSRILISLLIGSVAGALGVIGFLQGKTTVDGLQADVIVTLMGIGYAGADFIEAFMTKAGTAGTRRLADSSGSGSAGGGA